MTLSWIVLLVLSISVLADAAAPGGSTVDIPMWALIAIAVVLALLLFGIAFFFLRRYLRSRRTLNTMDILEKQPTNDSVITAVDTKKPPAQRVDIESRLSSPASITNKKHVYKPSMVDPITLTSSDLFNDKMELNSDDAMQLFERYLQEERQQKSSTFLVGTVQQKMGTLRGTIRSTLRQSIRRQKTTSLQPPPLKHFFDVTSSSRTSMDILASSSLSHSNISHASISTTLQPIPPSPPVPAVTSPTSRPISGATLIPSSHQPSSPVSPPSPSSSYTPNQQPVSRDPSTNEQDESPCAKDPFAYEEPSVPSAAVVVASPDEDPVSVARRVIRSSSRKSKTRSTLVNEQAVLKMFQQEEERYEQMKFQQDPPFLPPVATQPPAAPRRASQDSTSFISNATSLQRRDTSSTRYLTNEVLLKRGQSILDSSQKRKSSVATATSPLSPTSTKQKTLGSNHMFQPEKLETRQHGFIPSIVTDLAATEPSPLTPDPISASKETRAVQDDDGEPASTKYALSDEEFIALQAKMNYNSHSPVSPSPLSTSTPTDLAPSPSSQRLTPPNLSPFLDPNRSPFAPQQPSPTPSSNLGSLILRQERLDNFEGRSMRTESSTGGHSRKSSGSAATMVRISQHSQTWSGRAKGPRSALPYGTGNASPYRDSSDFNGSDEALAYDTPHRISRIHSAADSELGMDDDSHIPSALRRKDLSSNLFYTIRSTRPKHRNGLPFWAQEPSTSTATILSPPSSTKTPAERERDQYLNTLH
ncbi:hypothetical protein DM01DRAFT_1194115 [Hesseltinella vesiculosa]|uniref:Uncharacterized protein n=1 Tax=Hesseltinella vesiculosa TaxID=101127 RepID=A0A1X2G3U6_9FUNG|nr:hypothetical protein DM01DRAFT_1194115 [Hesseltinella vesiculosa]